MEEKGKKGNSLVKKTWERCKSTLGGSGSSSGRSRNKSTLGKKSKSWPRLVVPEGCFTVYVGPTRQRFSVKTEHANHPLFRRLLEEAESEFGYDNNHGPLTLPCDVTLFRHIILQMDMDDDDDVTLRHHVPACAAFVSAKRHNSYSSSTVASPYHLLSRHHSFMIS